MNRFSSQQPTPMDLEKQVSHIATVVDLMSKDQGEFKQRLERGIDEIRADVRALKEGRLREFDLHVVKTDTRLSTLEDEKISKKTFEEVQDELKWARRGVILALLTCLGTLIGMMLKH